jgi:cell division protease FtsH
MSGFRPNDGTIVIAATNRIDTLDPALLRPGRFDRQIEVGLPGIQQRLSILKLHVKNKPLERDVDLDTLAADTAFFSGASLESMLNEAAIFAAAQGAPRISRRDIDRAYLSIVAGEDRPPRANPDEKAVIALHEAGHALSTRIFLPDQRLTRVSILPTGRGAAGYSLSIPNESIVVTKVKLLSQVRVLLAGRAAEMLVGGADSLTGGAANDLKRAAELVATMVMDLGMEAEPGVALRGVAKACGAGAPNAFKLCRDALNREFEATGAALKQNLTRLMALAEALVRREALGGAELAEFLDGLDNRR